MAGLGAMKAVVLGFSGPAGSGDLVAVACVSPGELASDIARDEMFTGRSSGVASVRTLDPDDASVEMKRHGWVSS